MSDILLATETCIPPLRSHLVNRAHLIQRLNDGIDQNCRLILVSAPAGFGKTTLINDWIHQVNIPTAWLSLDRRDNDPIRFISQLAVAIQKVAPEHGNHILAAMKVPQPPDPETAATILINEFMEYPTLDGQNQPNVLVLDDYHEIVADAVHDMLVFLLDHLPSQVHLLVATRVDPPWPLARFRANREVVELRARDLRFTSQETTAFLNGVMSLNLSTESISLLDARTEGWIAGLQMAALSLQGRDDTTAFIRSFSGSHRFVLDYLMEEVLNRQSHELQEFLLKTSILDRLTASLCDAVTDRTDSQTILTWLERANLFLVPLDDERIWYRYHHLFADLLRNYLEKSSPDQVSTLQSRASTWYRERELFTPAINYALQAKDIDLVEQLVMQDVLAVSYFGELYTLIESIERLPGDIVRSHPWLSIAYAWALRSAGRLDHAETLLRDIEDVLAEGYVGEEVDGATSQVNHMRGHIAALRSCLIVPEENWDSAIDLARTALDLLPETDLRTRAFVIGWLASLLSSTAQNEAAMETMKQAVVLSQKVGDISFTIYELGQLAGMQLFQGQLSKALATYQDVIRLVDTDTRQSGYFSFAAKDAYLFAGRTLYELNDLVNAEHAIRKGIELCERSRSIEETGFEYFLLARVLHAKGDIHASQIELDRTRRNYQRSTNWLASYVVAWEALLCLQQGNRDAAIQWAQESGLSFDDDVSLRTYVKHIILARVLIAQGRSELIQTGSDRRLHEANILLDRLVNLVEPTGSLKYIIETQAVQAMAFYARGDLQKSLQTLNRALTLAEPEGYVRTFVDEGAPMEELLKEAADHGIMPGYIARLLAVLEKQRPFIQEARPAKIDLPLPSTGHPQSTVESLTERELETLRLLRTSLSLPEIADRMTVSSNTVRSHVKHIYTKLDAHSRIMAIERAKELGLI